MATEESLREKLSHLDAALTCVKSFRTAIDVGAHVGTWTKVMAGRFEKVVAFEPLPINQERWRRNMVGIENVMLICGAAGDENTKVRLEGDRRSKHFCVKDAAGAVVMQKIDDLGITDLDLLKVDAEGADALVLKGAEQTIRRCRPVVVVESIVDHEARYGLSAGAPMRWLEGLGARQVAERWPDYIYVFPDRP